MLGGATIRAVSNEPLSVYVHIPFCSLKCAYCDFNSYTKLDELVPAFVEALIAEVGLWGPVVKGRPVETVFFGGGTPSLLPIGDIERIMGALRERFGIAEGAEVSLEANPGTVDVAYFRGLLSAGVNRLSMGFQSFHDDELLALDRIHSAEEAKQAYEWAREAGFQRVNLDLIYGLADQELGRWQENLEQAIALGPEHLSLYALTIEEGTKLAYDVAHGTVPEPDPDLQAEMYEWSQKRLAGTDYRQYEISNWALPGEECRHNMVYWQNGEWLALGPGAHAHWGGFRFADVYSPRKYIELVREAVGATGRSPLRPDSPSDILAAMKQVTFIDPQPAELQMADTAILALRLNEGLDLAEFKRRFGRTLDEVYGPTIVEFMEAGFIERANGHLRLTDRGRYVANELFVRLLPD